MVIGPLRSYQDVYVAACGQPFMNRSAGVQHEKHCEACGEAIGEANQSDDTRADELKENSR